MAVFASGQNRETADVGEKGVRGVIDGRLGCMDGKTSPVASQPQVVFIVNVQDGCPLPDLRSDGVGEEVILSRNEFLTIPKVEVGRGVDKSDPLQRFQVAGSRQ